MEFVKGGVEFLGLAPSDEEAMLKMIETGGRTCYRSEDKTTSDSYKTFFKKIIGTKHLSVLEKSNICVKIPNSQNQQFYMYLTHLIYTSKQGGFFEVHMYRGDCYVAANLRAWLMFFVNSFKTLNLDLTENNLVCEFYVTLRTKYPFIFASFEKTLENSFDEFFSQYKCSFDIEVIDEREQLRLLIESNRVLNLPVFIFRAKTCRGITHEVVRNRSLSFLQESTRYCVAGDMILSTSNIRNKMSVSELYENKINSKNGSWKRINLKQLNESTGELQFAPIDDVFYMGDKETIKIKTRLGYEIICTPDHEIYTSGGYKKGSDLHIGDDIGVNGISLLYRNFDWLYHQYNTLFKTAVDIANEFGFNVSTIKKWVRVFNLPKKPLSYWNIGSSPWNKGLTEHEDPRVKKQADSLRKYHWDFGRVVVNVRDRIKKLGKSNYHQLVDDFCEICGTRHNLIVHHIDSDRENNELLNLLTVCKSCHGLVHSKNLTVVYYDKIVSIDHAGIVPVYDISMKSPYHNFIANGVVVHNCNYLKKFGLQFFNDFDRLEHNEVFDKEHVDKTSAKMMKLYNDIEETYNTLVEERETSDGAKKKLLRPEIARNILPNSLMADIIIAGRLSDGDDFYGYDTSSSLTHFIKQRGSAAAHPDIRPIAASMFKYIDALINQ